jgi:hypothetical protein
MANTPLVGANDTSQVWTATTYYSLGDSYGYTGTETNEQITWRSPGVFSKMSWVILPTNARTATTTFNFRKNVGNGNEVVGPIAAGGTGTFYDTTHTDSVVAGDKVNASVNGVAGANSFCRAVLSILDPLRNDLCCGFLPNVFNHSMLLF